MLRRRCFFLECVSANTCFCVHTWAALDQLMDCSSKNFKHFAAPIHQSTDRVVGRFLNPKPPKTPFFISELFSPKKKIVSFYHSSSPSWFIKLGGFITPPYIHTTSMHWSACCRCLRTPYVHHETPVYTLMESKEIIAFVFMEMDSHGPCWMYT